MTDEQRRKTSRAGILVPITGFLAIVLGLVISAYFTASGPQTPTASASDQAPINSNLLTPALLRCANSTASKTHDACLKRQ